MKFWQRFVESFQKGPLGEGEIIKACCLLFLHMGCWTVIFGLYSMKMLGIGKGQFSKLITFFLLWFSRIFYEIEVFKVYILEKILYY